MTMRFAYENAAAHAEPRASVSGRLGALPGAAISMLRLWARRRHSRRDLPRLDDHMLRDIGLDRSRADELARPLRRA